MPNTEHFHILFHIKIKNHKTKIKTKYIKNTYFIILILFLWGILLIISEDVL